MVMNKQGQTIWERNPFNKKNKSQFNLNKTYVKGDLIKIRGQKLNSNNKSTLFYDIIFDDGQLFRASGSRIDKLI